jgi:SAM-dependent methyltransferase
MKTDASLLNQLSQQTAQRYGERYGRLGRHIRSLGWGCEEDQDIRFKQSLRLLPEQVGTLLDIGCGFADLLTFFSSSNVALTHYIGWDITPSFIDECQKLHGSNSRVEFAVCDLSEMSMDAPVADCAVMLGLLNFNWKGQINNFEYSCTMIRRAFAAVRDTLIVDFLSTKLAPSYPAEAQVVYHDPAAMLDFALSLTHSASLLHDYAPIPQREFMLALRHRP